MDAPDPILERAKTAAGGVTTLAKALGITSQAVSQWTRIPPSRAAEIAKLTGIPCHELRPDIFPSPSNEAA